MWDMMACEATLNKALTRKCDKEALRDTRERLVNHILELNTKLVAVQELLENDFQRILGFPE
jgi:hypothetical protein